MQAPPARKQHQTGRWYLPIAVLLLLTAAFFRTWQLGSVPPGLHAEEIINAQISDQVKMGNIAVIYDEVEPAREVLYYILLAISSAFSDGGTIFWRIPSAWISLLTLAISTQLMRRLFGVRVALLSLGLTAVAFWPIWVGRTVQHITLMPLITGFAAFTLYRAFESRENSESSLWFTLGGMTLGLAQYVHVTAWTLIALFVLFVAYHRIVDPADLRRHRANITYALMLAVVIMLPLLIFIVRNPGIRELTPLADQSGIITDLPRRVATMIAGLFYRGDMLPYHNLPGRPVMDIMSGGLLFVGLGVALARWRRQTFGLAILWFFVGLLPSVLLPRQPNFEYMGVLIPIVFVFPAIGLRAIFEWVRRASKPHFRELLTSGISILVIALIAGNAVWTFMDYFVRWPSLGDVRLNYQADLGVLAHYLDVSTEQTPISVCSVPVDNSSDPFALTNQDLLGYLMHRTDLPVRYFDCTQSLVLADGGGSQRVIFPRGHYYDRLPSALLGWMRYAENEELEGLRPDVMMRLDATDEFARFAGNFTSEALAAYPPEAKLSGVASLPASFGYNIAFLGYEIYDDHLLPGDWLEVTTYWRVDGPPPQEMTVFVHVLGSPVVVIAQRDSLGIQSGTLQTRDIFIQNSLIQIPGGVSAGEYQLSVGLYLNDPSQRLPLFVDGEQVADRLILRSISIER